LTVISKPAEQVRPPTAQLRTLLAPIASLLRWFLQANKKVARRLKPRLSPGDVDMYNKYDALVASYASEAPTPVIVDVGGGKHCSFAHLVPRDGSLRIVGVDISEQELAYNDLVDEKRVGDATKSLPLADGEAGMIVSRTLVEHLADVDAFVANTSRALAPGGYTVHLVPGRYSLFALAARAVPFPLAKRILHVLRPEMKGIVEFPVFYDRCYWTALHDVFRDHGLEVVHAEVTYSQADYFDAFLPAYLACATFEAIVGALGARQLAAYVLIAAAKPRNESSDDPIDEPAVRAGSSTN